MDLVLSNRFPNDFEIWLANGNYAPLNDHRRASPSAISMLRFRRETDSAFPVLLEFFQSALSLPLSRIPRSGSSNGRYSACCRALALPVLLTLRKRYAPDAIE